MTKYQLEDKKSQESLVQRVSTPFLPAETQLNTQKNKFDQKFDFEERGYFGTKRTKQKKTLN